MFLFTKKSKKNKSISRSSSKKSKKSKKIYNNKNNNNNPKQFIYDIVYCSACNYVIVEFTHLEVKLYIADNKILKPENFKYNNLIKTKIYKTWRTISYKYKSVLFSNNYSVKDNSKDNYENKGNVMTYPNFPKTSTIQYMLVNLDDKKYLSIGYKIFEFQIPDNDKILFASMGSSRGDNQNAFLIGEKYTYQINDGSLFDDDFYIANETIKENKLPSNPHNIDIDYSNGKYYIKIKNNKVFDLVNVLDIGVIDIYKR
jgi:hypothetical protein